jgi:uncharacterized membrane protein (UPF0127 family)
MVFKDQLHYFSLTGEKIPVKVASSFKSRFLGLMGKKEENFGLLLVPCNSIHTFFMRYSIDAVFLDRQNRIVSIKRCIKPFSFTLPVRHAVKVLEVPSSLKAFELLETGDSINLY